MASSLNEEFTDLNSAFEKEEVPKSISLRDRVFVPKKLPDDFLRVITNQNVQTNQDYTLARQLQNELNRQMESPVLYEQNADLIRGRLQIDFVEAKLNKNYGLTRMDPYVRFKLGNRVLETPTSYNGSKNPIWKKKFILNLPPDVDSLNIEIYDEKSFTEDEMIAFVKYPLQSKLFDGVFIDEWIPLSGRLGEQKEGYINIHLLFTPIDQIRPKPIIMQNRMIPNTSDINNQFIQPGIIDLPQELIATSKTYNEDLSSLKEMFPSFDDDVIKSVYESSGHVKETAIDALIQMTC
ncbi:toll-interacting [Brachionus plicatilis]|uniref:Toll-interacting n=1 Tax=Brachionus plicatilis TaxID=10195 RepID=A0A3M7RLU8_BRAPC|nr:toll-interacting [Brachionus plicatilis]